VSVPPAVPEGTAGHDGPRWLPSRVPTSAIDRIVKESIRFRGAPGGSRHLGGPIRRDRPGRRAPWGHRPGRRTDLFPTPRRAVWFAVFPGNRRQDGRPRRSAPAVVTPCITLGPPSGSLRSTRSSEGSAGVPTRVLRPTRRPVRPGPLVSPGRSAARSTRDPTPDRPPGSLPVPGRSTATPAGYTRRSSPGHRCPGPGADPAGGRARLPVRICRFGRHLAPPAGSIAGAGTTSADTFD
jgi:hypothetical protein